MLKTQLATIKKSLRTQEIRSKERDRVKSEWEFVKAYIHNKHPTITTDQYTSQMKLKASNVYWSLMKNHTHMLTLTFSNDPYTVGTETAMRSLSNYLNRLDRAVLGNKVRSKTNPKRIRRTTYFELGKNKTNPHFHILLTQPKSINAVEDFEDKALTIWKQIHRAHSAHIDAIYDMHGVLSYPLKELVNLSDEVLIPDFTV